MSEEIYTVTRKYKLVKGDGGCYGCVFNCDAVDCEKVLIDGRKIVKMCDLDGIFVDVGDL